MALVNDDKPIVLILEFSFEVARITVIIISITIALNFINEFPNTSGGDVVNVILHFICCILIKQLDGVNPCGFNGRRCDDKHLALTSVIIGELEEMLDNK